MRQDRSPFAVHRPAGSNDQTPPPPHANRAADVATGLRVHPERGLASAEAAARLAHYGRNALETQGPPGFWALGLRQFQSPLILILVLAAAISLVVGDPQDALVIGIVLVLNSVIGAVQESRAERALSALRASSPAKARVLRGGESCEVPADELVPGDVVLVRGGDVVPADGRLESAVGLEVDESALTGESLPVEKDAVATLPIETALPDRINMAFHGTAVTLGHGVVLVTATGADTELGRLARLVTEAAPPPTPLQRQIAWLGKALSILAIVVSVFVLILGIWRGQPPAEMTMVALSLAVAAVPEGLPAVVTIVLAIGVQRMARRRAIVRRLAAVEALGSATVICTDKTGTLTLGEMRVGSIHIGGRRLELSSGVLRENGRAVSLAEVAGMSRLLRAAALCNNAALGPTPTGDPTERALLLMVRELGIDGQNLERASPRVGEIPFSSDRKRMSSVHRADGQLIAYMKGAPDAVLARCDSLLAADGVVPLSEAERTALEDAVATLAAQGLRVLALAERRLPASDIQMAPRDEIERDLTLLAFVGLIDPPRPEVPAALADSRAAGIRTVMITGDHPSTARTIALRLGIADGGILTGAALEGADSGVRADASIYARVAPQQKLEIVRALQERDEVVAMTGDGANDAPALRLADVGVAMGIRGTPVSKEAADIVLADDHYATIVAAIEEGRAIFANLRKAVLYLISGNLGEILVILVAMLVGSPLPLQAVQILWINLLTDALPALGLGMEPPEPGVMSHPPRRPGEPFLPRWTVPLIAVPSILLATVTLAAFAGALARDPNNLAAAQTAAFVTLVLAHLGIGWAQRATLAPSFRLSLRSNPTLVLSVLVGAGSILLLLYTELGRDLFHTYPLDLAAWALALALTPIPFLGSEVSKAVVRKVRG